MQDSVKTGIVVPNDFIKRLPFGGASGFVQNLAGELSSRTVIFGAGANGTPLWSPGEVGGVTFTAVYPIRFPSSVPLRICAFWGYLRHRRRILDSGVELIYVHSPECALPFLFGRRRLPVVFHQHGSGNPVATSTYPWARNTFLMRLFDRMHRIIYSRADWIVAIDPLCLEQARAGGAEHKVSLIMNAVDRHRFRPDQASRQALRREHGCRDDELMVLFVGRLEEIKQVDRLVDAVALLKGKLPVRLLVAGGGSCREALEAQVRNLDLERSVLFTGQIPHDRLPGYYNMADALALPSKMEGAPMVILEALACGTPVVASAVGGIPELVRDGENGFLLRQCLPQVIAATLMQSSQHRWSRDEVAATVERWGAEEVAAQLSSIFARVTRGGGER